MMDLREVVVVGDELTSTGFALAGARSHKISEDNIDSLYEELKDKKAVLILTQHACRLLGEKAERLREKNIVLVIPEKKGEEYTAVKELIKRTVGFDTTKR